MKKFLKIFFLALVLFFVFLYQARALIIENMVFDYSVQPGEKIEGKITLRNDEKKIQDVKVYQTDYLFYSDGNNYYNEPGSHPRSNANWIEFSPSRLSIPSGESASVYFKVSVPKDEKLSGTYWSMLMVEPLTESSAESPRFEKDRIKFGVQIQLRYAVQIATTIGETQASIKFLDKKISREKGETVLYVDIENTGNGTLVPEVSAELYSKKGESLGRYKSASGLLRIYPGCSVRHKINFGELSKGNYRALVMVDNKDENVFGAQYDILVK